MGDVDSSLDVSSRREGKTGGINGPENETAPPGGRANQHSRWQSDTVRFLPPWEGKLLSDGMNNTDASSSRLREGTPNTEKGLAEPAGPFPFRGHRGRCYAGGMIRLAHVDPDAFEIPDGMIGVGFLDAGAVLAYDADRRPHRVVEGIATPLDAADVNASLASAVEEAASRLWPEGWSYAMAEAFGINRRGLQRDRLAKSGLHPTVLQELGALSCHDDAEGIGRLAHALAWYADRCSDRDHPSDRLADAEQGALNALAGLRRVRRGRVTKPGDDPDK